MATLSRNVAGPLLFLNLVMYFVIVGFASWCLNRWINGHTHDPSIGGNSVTLFFLIFALLAGVVGIVSKLAGGTHIRAWRSDSPASAASSALIAWAVTALTFGSACKEINVRGWKEWRLKVLEAFIIILTFTQLLYALRLHAGMYDRTYGPGYTDVQYGPNGNKGGGGGGGATTGPTVLYRNDDDI